MSEPVGEKIKEFFREAKLQVFRGHTAQAEANVATSPYAKVAKAAGYVMLGAAYAGVLSLLFAAPIASTAVSGAFLTAIWYGNERALSHVAPHNRPLENTKNPLKLVSRFFKDMGAQVFHASQPQTTEDLVTRPAAKVAKAVGFVGAAAGLSYMFGPVIGLGITALVGYFNHKSTKNNKMMMGIGEYNPRNKNGGGPRFKI